MKEDKFTVMYSFKVHEGKAEDFIIAWTEMTKLIYAFEGSYGSRLHKVNDGLFIGYAQWPNKATWKNSGNKLPDAAVEFRRKLRECCLEIKTEYELESVVDLLYDKTFKQ